METPNNVVDSQWIRGVNLGGWLLLERFITPYLFAISDCDLRGDFRFFPGQLGAPVAESLALDKSNVTLCKPVLPYPVDEYTLAAAFPSKPLARAYLERHWESFVTLQDLQNIKESGLDYVRVPLPHWIFGDIQEGEPWVDGQWVHFVRVASWCRNLGLQIWPDIHSAPGSQNGFDNSGQLLESPTGTGWSSSPVHVSRSIQVVQNLVNKIKQAGIQDVVTGIGVLNEPFKDVPLAIMKDFNDKTLTIIREGLGKDVKVFIPDLFNSTWWGHGYWTDADKFANTVLDSHYYHVFAEEPRALSPKQHIAYVCRYNSYYTTACCYDEKEESNKIPSKGISRMIGEWSTAFDTLVVDKLTDVMDEISKTGKALEFDRQISKERQAFLQKFAESQMVTYEAKSAGVSRGWFYWNFKVEGGAFAEWDYLRGIREGWIPKTERGVASVDRFGTCEDILMETDDNESIIHEFPDPKSLPDGVNWQGVAIDDDLVLSHGQTLSNGANKKAVNIDDTHKVQVATIDGKPSVAPNENTAKALPLSSSSLGNHRFILFVAIVAGMLIYRFFRRQRYSSYQSLDSNHGSYQMNV
mmetsp:Transcript_20883/g.29798  ORF Transcript_20883/g.29798 Transcript_20883/m.29798 type:complete len:582 (-) Transcript_20883:868-2613(-)